MALVPPQYLDAVVSIEIKEKTPDGKEELKPIATGLLYGKLLEKDEKENVSTYSIYLVTNRHVFENPLTHQLLGSVELRFNLSDDTAKNYTVELLDSKNNPKWLKHKNDQVDLAVMPLSVGAIKKEKIKFYYFREDADVCFAKDFHKTGVSTGDGIFILGFPLGIRGETRNYVVVKGGVISRFDEELLKEHYYYVDSSVYPGNSGGPVVYKPEIVAIQGTTAVGKSTLIGIVSKGESYREIAISPQTGRTRIVFEEQSGLVRVVPIDSVNEVINQYVEEKGLPKQKVKSESGE